MKPKTGVQIVQKRKKKNTVKKKKTGNLESMSVDDFLNNGFDLSEESEDEKNAVGSRHVKTLTVSKGKSNDAESGDSLDESEPGSENKLEMEDEFNERQDSDDSEGDSDAEEEESKSRTSGTMSDADDNDNGSDHDNGDEDDYEQDDVDDEGDWTSANFSHKRAVAKLQKTDPEFYKFLQDNDKDLLNFDESDNEAEQKEDKEKGGKLHKPPQGLEVDSDESDYEEAGVKKDSRAITLKLVTEWETQLQNTSVKSCETIIDVIHAFHAVVVRVSNDDDPSAKYVVTGSSVFNAVIQLCVLELQPALKRFLRIPRGSHVDPTKNKIQWTKVQKSIRSYVNNLIKLLAGVTSTHILAVMLKHLHQMMPFAACFVLLHRPLMKMLVKLWSTSEETVRVIAFLCILRLTTHQQDKILDKILKMMHLAYVRNCKFVSPNTLPAINFMRRSLVEIFALDLNIAYQHAFLYIRQLAIHLRNAITLQKKEHFQAVLNWQFINSIRLWANLLGATANKPQLQALVYPLVQVTTGTIKLMPTTHYFPLRFHCTQILIELSKMTCTFIPVLPFLLEVLDTVNFNIPHKKVSMKPVVFTFVLRVTKPQMQENGFKDVVIDSIYQQLLEYLTNESHSIAFPDLIIPAVIQIKKFLKTCKVSNYCRKMKQLYDKIEDNAKVVEKERQKVTFKLSDHKSIAAWETQLQLKGTPLMKYYESWNKVNVLKQAKKATQNDKLADFNLPKLKKGVGEQKPKPDGPVVLFPSDDSDSDMNIMKSGDDEPSKKRGKRGGKNAGKSKKLSTQFKSIEHMNEDIDDADDIVEDLKLEDL